MNHVQLAADILYKQQFGRMVASLLHFSRDIDPETAEDIVQDSFAAALTSWSKQGIPDHAAGWLFRVSRNKALNYLKKDRLQGITSDQIPDEVESIPRNESLIADEQLKLLFACAHPDLSPKTQIAITLKYVVNLRVEAIANLLALTIDGVDKLLGRARKKIKEERILLTEPSAASLHQRLPIVHKIIYCTFNEGYKSSGGKEIIREQLCEDALLLNKAILDSPLSNPETKALQALMLFNAARFEARFSKSGELVDLENQDRSLWNHDLIFLASEFLTDSQDANVSTYHLEAAIASIHCRTKNFKETDWKLIAGLYARLFYIRPNPFVKLNYSIALYYSGNKKDAFDILTELQTHAFLSQYFLLNMTLGKFHKLEGNFQMARWFLVKALHQTKAGKEIDFIQNMINTTSGADHTTEGKNTATNFTV